MPENNTVICVYGGIFNQSGIAWFDCFQLEPGESADAFNLVNNASFKRGRRLAALTKGGVNSSYTYDDKGIRTSKTVGGTKTTYYLNGSTILTQISGSTRLDFFYDAAGAAAGFKYNGETYYYTRNL